MSCDECGKKIKNNHYIVKIGSMEYKICSHECLDSISKRSWETRCQIIEGNINSNFEQYDADLYNCFESLNALGISKILIHENEVHIHYTSGKMVIFKEATT